MKTKYDELRESGKKKRLTYREDRISAFIGKIASLQDDVQMLEDELFEYKQDLEGDLCALDDREKCGAVGADMQKRIDALNAAILRLDYATDNLNAAARCLTK